jgi:hypothetical protein
MKRAQQAPVLELIESIRQRNLAGRSLRKVDRQRCVECLSAEGASLPEISKLMGFHERTIQRDREEIRRRNALRVGDCFAAEVAGEFVRDHRAGIDRLRRITHDKQATPADRIEAEKAVLTAHSRMVELLQSMGYLPTAPRTVVAGVTALRGEPPNLYEEAKRLTSIVEQVAHVLPAPGNSEAGDSSAAEGG